MPRRIPKPLQVDPSFIAPALSPEAEESQMISLATNLAKQRLLDGTASAQEVTFYLKLGTTRERIERDILLKQRDLLAAKKEAIESAERVEKLYSEAIEAMRHYGGHDNESENQDLY